MGFIKNLIRLILSPFVLIIMLFIMLLCSLLLMIVIPLKITYAYIIDDLNWKGDV